MVGLGTCGHAVGADATCAALVDEVQRLGLPLAVVAGGCNGLCWAAPAVDIVGEGRPRTVAGVTGHAVPRLLDALATQATLPGELEPAVLARQQRVLLERWGGRLRLIAPVHDPGVVRVLLAHLGWRRPQTAPGPAPPQPDHAAATGSPPPGGQAGPSRSAQRAPRSTATAARAAVCAAQPLTRPLTMSLSRVQDRRRSRIRAGRSRLQGGLWGRRLDDAGVFQGVLDARWMGLRDANWR